jgi:hypothetical protein
MRFLFAVVLALGIAAAAYGAAASLTVNGGTVQAGSDSVTGCDTGGVDVSYTVLYDSSVPGFKVTAVTVSNIDPACNGKKIDVVLTQGGNNVGLASGTVGSGSFSGSVLPTPDAADVDDVHVVIH